MTCSILSAIIASTKVMNWARNPGCRIAANDRRADGGALAGIDWESLIRNHHHAARDLGHIRQREAWDMFERIREPGFTAGSAALSMVDQGTAPAPNAALPRRRPRPAFGMEAASSRAGRAGRVFYQKKP